MKPDGHKFEALGLVRNGSKSTDKNIQRADPIKEKVHFGYYRLAKGISGILSYAKEDVSLWFRTADWCVGKI